MSIWNMLEKHWNICVSLKFQPSERSRTAVGGLCGSGWKGPASPLLSLSIWWTCWLWAPGRAQDAFHRGRAAGVRQRLGDAGCQGAVGKGVASLQDQPRQRGGAASCLVGSCVPRPSACPTEHLAASSVAHLPLPNLARAWAPGCRTCSLPLAPAIATGSGAG